MRKAKTWRLITGGGKLITAKWPTESLLPFANNVGENAGQGHGFTSFGIITGLRCEAHDQDDVINGRMHCVERLPVIIMLDGRDEITMPNHFRQQRPVPSV